MDPPAGVGDFSGGIMCGYAVSIFCEQVVDIMKGSEKGTNCAQYFKFSEYPVVRMRAHTNISFEISVSDPLCEMGAR